MHAVRDTAQYRRRHAAVMAKMRQTGRRVTVAESREPIEARIDHGRLIVDCPCGAGNAVDADATLACCFGCGLVHLHVVLPPKKDLAAIEKVLLRRQRPHHRNWTPGETVEKLQAENERHPKGLVQ